MKEFFHCMGIDLNNLNFSDCIFLTFLFLASLVAIGFVILPLSLSIFGVETAPIISFISDIYNKLFSFNF